MGAQEHTEAPGGAVVLVVDDHPANRELARATLEDEGHVVHLAEGGTAALETFARIAPDCVLLDIRMPDMDGFETCRRMRALPGGAETPIIFITALRDVDAFDHAQAVGADDFLTKPVRPTELIIRVSAALKLRRVTAERHELYDLLRRQRDDLMRATLQHERLTAFLVHDLKNPVAGMQLAADLLLRFPEPAERVVDIAERIKREAQGLLRMIMELLDISRADAGSMTIARTPLDLCTLVGETLESMAPAAESNEVTLEADVGAWRAHADAHLVRRVLENLVDNAIRHAPPGTRVQVKTAPLEPDRGTGVYLRVSDAGRGVPAELRERIFDRFVQADAPAAARARTNRGLGLAFCKLVAEAHGGAIWVEDATPGASFVVRLPDDS